MKDRPLVSVIVTTKNEEKNIENFCKSVKDQSYENIELIVVDNNSTDKTKEIAKKYTGKVFNKGPERSAQRNYGAKKAKGEYLLIHDSDIYFHPDSVQECIDLALNNKADAVILPEESIGEGYWAKVKAFERSFYTGNDYIEAVRFFSKKAYDELGGYDEDMYAGEDWDLTIRFRKNNYKIMRVKNNIAHNEGRLNLFGCSEKKKYYAENLFKYYVKKNPNEFKEQMKFFNRFPVNKIMTKGIRHPILFTSMIFMKGLELYNSKKSIGMILIISHYAKNKGVTDHFISFLQDNKKEYFYLRHPFADNTSNYSELLKYDGYKEIVLKSFKKSNNSIIVLAQDFLINLFTSIYLGKKVNKVFGFGSFNVIAHIWTNFIFRRKIFFWGCDYSEVRFSNKILNFIYLWFETIACKYSYKTIHPSSRQEEVRIRLHQLKPENSILVPNGIDKVRVLDWNKYKKIGLLYIGSITEQHGIIQLIKSLYIDNNINYPLYIFGSGNIVDELNNTIKKFNLENKVIYKGYMNPDDIYKYLYMQKINFIGLAPYNFNKDTHVKYGDSLKVKDYLSVGIPYIAPSQLHIQEDLKEFGYINTNIINIIINLKIKNLDYNKLDKVMNKYIRSNIYNSLLIKYI